MGTTRQTALYDRHVALGGRLVEFSGWQLPVQYQGIIAEHKAGRRQAAVFDTSHMGQLYIEGPAAGAALARVCTQNAADLAVGKCGYGFLLNASGGVIDDTILMRLDEQRFLLVVNAGTRGEDAEWLASHLPGDLPVRDALAEGWGKIDVQGPDAHAVLAPLVGEALAKLKYFRVAEMTCLGRPCVISRTGYTGELGYELMAAGEDLLAIFDELMAGGRVTPAGLGARDSLRLEMGMPLYGHELNPQTTPLEADLGRFVDTEREFIGAAALRQQAESGIARKLVGLAAETRRRAAEGDPITCDGRDVGVVTSSAFSPSLETSIAMGYVATDVAEIGQTLAIGTARKELPVRVTERPFYTQGTCRTSVTPRENA